MTQQKYIVAVSGGVDSVVLLDMLVKQADHQLIVAHFDHGIRPDSAQDAEFVAGLAQKYSLQFELKREELGGGASEDLARRRRYLFLRDLAQKHAAKIVTAHHADDAVETVAINLVRGTGWRGLAALNSKDIYRPLLNRTKAELLEYAQANRLEWREDPTNTLDKYLRNRLRRNLKGFEPDKKWQILALRQAQIEVNQQIDAQIDELIKSTKIDRYFITQIPQPVALEILRRLTKQRLTRPQLEKLLLAIKTFAPNKTLQAGSGVNVNFTTRNFLIKLVE